MRLRCTACGATLPIRPSVACECGGTLDVEYDWAQLSTWKPSGSRLARYDRLLPLPPEPMRVTLGEGSTPLIAAEETLLKCEHLNPTGSYKDRIAAVGISIGVAHGASAWVGSSSGNASASFSAYGARAGLRGTVFTAAGIAPEKLAQVAAFGTRIFVVEGFLRNPSADEAAFKGIQRLALRRGLVLGITARTYSPAAMEGVKTIAYEIIEEIGHPPTAVYVPTGGGGLITSLWAGFRDWMRLGFSKETPRMVAVQPSGCDPIHRAAVANEERVAPIPACLSEISGLQLPAPPDGDLVLQTIRESSGFSLAVSDESAFRAQRELAQRFGVFVEPAAALAYAGYQEAPLSGAVIVLTGSGLKTSTATLGTPELTTIRADRIDQLW